MGHNFIPLLWFVTGFIILITLHVFAEGLWQSSHNNIKNDNGHDDNDSKKIYQ